MSNPADNGSFWFESLQEGRFVAEPAEPPEALDVAIIGAGFTGLWTAYYLKQAEPSLEIAVFDANGVGFGASGRNGGWCMGLAYGVKEMLDHPDRRSRGLEVLGAMQDTVDEVGRVCQRENVDCHYAKGGALRVATSPLHVDRLRASVEHMHELGLSDDDYTWLPADEATARVGITPNYGAEFTPHCAAIHPARLVHGLAATVQRQGTAVFENTPVLGFAPGRIETEQRTIRAARIVRATEGYTDTLRGEERKMLPLYSMVVATEPLPQAVWDTLGLTRRETFGDARRIVIYGQRTLDDRLVFGGRAGYYFGSKIKPVIAKDDALLDGVEETLRSIVPALAGHEVTHRWGGLMGVQRHWRPTVTFDAASGIGSAGGYVGEGVAASNLAARVLTDLMLERDTDLTRLAWVDDTPRRWEPEPARWLGAKLLYVAGRRADAAEFRTGQPAGLWGSLFDRAISRRG